MQVQPLPSVCGRPYYRDKLRSGGQQAQLSVQCMLYEYPLHKNR